MDSEMTARKITRADILPPAEYAAKRGDLRKQVVAMKRNRRIEVGPVATFYFESFETMLQQIQEMLHIEKGGEEQIAGELAAYNPLIPNGRELIATVMFEIDDPIRRARILARLGGVEATAFIKLDGDTVKGVPEEDLDRTNAEGKASSVQFIHFTFTPQQIALFREPDRQVVIGFSHPEYSHMAVVSEAVRSALARDFD
jgi:Protein of unknown function (DUF3501)